MFKRLVVSILFLFITSGAVSAEGYTEGVEYKRVAEQPTDTGDKIEILEFFWYGCPHCYKFDPILSEWLKTKPDDVEFVRVPAVFRPEWKVHARTYYALQAMGLGEKYHDDVFHAMHRDKKNIYTFEAMVDFLVSKGVNKDEFESAYNSFSIDGQVRKAIKRVKDYAIEGVPAIAVNGRYLISGKSAGSYENMLRIVDYLIKQESAAKK